MSEKITGKEILRNIDNRIIENEVNILKNIAKEFIDIENKNPIEIREELLEFERSGKTGFDCGWSWLVIDNEDINKDLKKQNDNLNKNSVSDYVTLFPRKIGQFENYGMQARLVNYPLNVQSTRIKNMLLNEIKSYLKEYNIDSYVETIID